jgi:hypothetical protein
MSTAGLVLALCTTLATATAVPRPTVLLLDGGSKRATAVLSLRRAAAQLQAALGDGREVRPVSLKWVDWVPADELGGVPARLLRAELEAMAAAGERHAVVAPLFLGPSDALATGVAAAAAELDVELRLGECLVTEQAPDDARVGQAMADGVLRLADEKGLAEPLKVVLVDHGTPSARVNAVRGRLCRELEEELGARAPAQLYNKGLALPAAHAAPQSTHLLRAVLSPRGPRGAAWPHGRMAAWPHGRMAAWPHGRMAAWPHGRMARTCMARTLVPAQSYRCRCLVATQAPRWWWPPPWSGVPELPTTSTSRCSRGCSSQVSC